MLPGAAVTCVGFYPQILWTGLLKEAKSSLQEAGDLPPVGFLKLAIGRVDLADSGASARSVGASALSGDGGLDR